MHMQVIRHGMLMATARMEKVNLQGKVFSILTTISKSITSLISARVI